MKIMTLEDFRDLTSELPGDTEIVIHPGDLEHSEIRLDKILPATSRHPMIVTLVMGQPINEDKNLYRRIDVQLGVCGHDPEKCTVNHYAEMEEDR